MNLWISVCLWQIIVCLYFGFCFVTVVVGQEQQLRKPNPPKLPANYPEIELPTGPGPHFYLNAEEVERLRTAYHGDGKAAFVLQEIVKTATTEVDKPIWFPPKGGLHSSLYHCPECQRKLKPQFDEARQMVGHRCAKCEKQYRGYPYDDVYYTTAHRDNFKLGFLAAKAFTLTGDEQFAKFVRDLLVGYADRYVGYQRTKGILTAGRYGHICSTDHEAGSLMMSYMGPAYDMVGHHSVFSHADHAQIKNDLIGPMMTYLDTATMRGKSNHHSFHNAGYIWGGALTGDKIRIAQALYGNGGGFFEQVKTAPSKEGLWPGGYAYHFYARRALVNTAEVARHLQIDLYSDPQFKKMFFLPAQEVMPDGTTPNFGDDPGMNVVGQPGAEEAYAAYKDAALLPLLQKAITFESIIAGRLESSDQIEFQQSSVHLPDSGHAILRGPGPANFVLAMQLGKYGTSHTHFDKLSYILYSNENRWVLDSGKRHSVDYASNVHQQYYRGTIGHNTVVVDGQSQSRNQSNCKLLEFQPIGEIPFVGASSSELYADVRHSRWLAIAPRYVLVMDEMLADEEHVYDWWHHSEGTLGVSSEAMSSGKGRDDFVDPGLKYIDNIKRGSSDQAVIWEVTQEDGRLQLTLAADGETNVLTGTGPLSSLDKRAPAVRFTRRGSNVDFAAVLQQVKQGDSPFVQSVIMSRVADQKTVVVNHENGQDTYVLSQDRLTVSSDGRTDKNRSN